MKNFLRVIVVGLALSVMPAAAQATCTITGTMARVTANSDSFSTFHFLYFRAFSTSSVYYFGRSFDDMIAEVATTAVANGTKVTVSGDAASCPTSGTGRFIGNVRWVSINP